MDPYEDWKDRFMRLRGQDRASMVTIEETCAFLFPLLWENHQPIKGIDFNELSSLSER